MNLNASNSNQLSCEVEFSNNGLTDSLTGAPAPKTFLDNLAREISQSRRKPQPIAIVTIKLLPRKTESKKSKNIKSLDQDFEKDLALISNSIKANMRGGDFYSRMAEDGFWLCLQANLGEANSSIERFEAKISDDLKRSTRQVQLKFTSSEWNSNLDSSSWIEEIDRKYF